jgi:hypothetical protein
MEISNEKSFQYKGVWNEEVIVGPIYINAKS